MYSAISGVGPKQNLPARSVDCHVHITDNAKVSDYRQVQSCLGLENVVLVQSNMYQKDNQLMLGALDQLGKSARAIVAVDSNASETELSAMHERGARGVRIVDLMNGAVRLNELLAVNAKVSPLGWSMIVQFNGHRIAENASLFEKIVGNFVIDHVGRYMPPVDVASQEFTQLLKLIDKGNCYVKIAGFYEYSKQGHPNYEDIAPLVKALLVHSPERVIWGSNWPHLMASSDSEHPDDVQLLDLVVEWISESCSLEQVFVDNPKRLYGF